MVAEEYSDEEVTSEEEEEESEEEDANEVFDLAERKVHTLVKYVKDELDGIHPGIGDRITLANFVYWVRSKSSCLEED